MRILRRESQFAIVFENVYARRGENTVNSKCDENPYTRMRVCYGFKRRRRATRVANPLCGLNIYRVKVPLRVTGKLATPTLSTHIARFPPTLDSHHMLRHDAAYQTCEAKMKASKQQEQARQERRKEVRRREEKRREKKKSK